VPKQSTGFSDLKKAEALRDSLLVHVKGDDINGPTVAECIEKYIVSRERELDERTLGQHRLALERLQRFLEGQGVQYIRSMTVDHLETFKTAGLPKHMADTTRATTDAKIRCFLRAAFRRAWIKEALVLKVNTVKAVYEQKEPYTGEEIEAILQQALLLNGGTHGYAKRPKTFRLLLEVMLETGLRVGDAVSFDPRLLTRGDSLWIYTFAPQKKKRTEKPRLLEAYLTEEMKTRIDECEWLSKKGPFWYGAGATNKSDGDGMNAQDRTLCEVTMDSCGSRGSFCGAQATVATNATCLPSKSIEPLEACLQGLSSKDIC
jgi:hypothetical protein